MTRGYFTDDSEYFSKSPTQARERVAYRDAKTGVFIASGTLPGGDSPYSESTLKII